MIKFDKKRFKTQRAVLTHLTKTHNKRISSIFSSVYNIPINKCAFCDNHAKVEIIFIEDENNFIFSDIKYPNNLYCKKVGCPGKKLNPMSREFIKKTRQLSENELNQYFSLKSNRGVSTLKSIGFFEDKSNNPYSKEFWNKQGIDGNIKIKERITKTFRTLESNGFFEDKSNNPYSKEFWIKKGMTHRDAQAKVNERNHVKIEYWMKLGYSKEESEILSKKSADTLSKQAFIRRHGRKKGLLKYESAVQLIKDSWTVEGISKLHGVSLSEAKEIREQKIKTAILSFKNSQYSKESFNFFINLIKDFPDKLKDLCLFGDSEFGKYDSLNKKYYFYDFVISKLKICIEYHGVKFHPKKITNEWKQLFTNASASDVFENDYNKKKLLEDLGYNYYIVWSDDYSASQIEKIKQTILQKYLELYGKNQTEH